MPELKLRHLNWIGSSWDEGKNRRGQFLASVASVPLTSVAQVGKEGKVTRRLVLGDLLDAEMLENAERTAPARHAEFVESGLATMAQWRIRLAATPPELKQENRALAESCLEVLAQLDSLVRAKCGNELEHPSFEPLVRLLEHLRNTLAGGPASAQGGADAGSALPDGADLGPGAGSAEAGALRTRADAVRRLKEVAAFLRHTEPHSPVSYLIERAVRWLSMPFETLLSDVLKAPDVVDKVRETLGMTPGKGDVEKPES
jgi:type VI secretion system protein ImpA